MTTISGFEDENWWEVDPYLEGFGLGVVLHERVQGDTVTWMVARTLKDSPAAQAGIRAGDQIAAIGPLTAATSDLDDIGYFLRRPNDVSWAVRTINAHGKVADVTLISKPLRAMWTEEMKGGGEAAGGACISCHLCAPRANGYLTCVIDGACEGRCMTA